MDEQYTLKYTGEQIDENLTKAGNAVLFTSQTLTESQKTLARENIGAVSETEVTTMINNALGVIENGTY